MKPFLLKTALLAVFMTIFACSTGEKKNESAGQTTPAHGSSAALNKPLDGQAIMKIDLEQDLVGKSLQELRLLRSAIYARHGYLFTEADLRAYFSANTSWYDSLMTARWEADEENGGTVSEIKLSEKEQAFVEKIKALEEKQKAYNYATTQAVKTGNVKNIINLFQFKTLPPEFMRKLADRNFVIVPNNNIQLFHLYEQNDYHQLPNFVTADLYLQLYHMYFSYLLKSLEQEKFIPVAAELTEGLYQEAMQTAASTPDPALKSLAEFTATFYAIPYRVLTGKKKSVPAKYQALFEEEIKHIEAGQDDSSEFLEFQEVPFAYSLFKPRGHYTRTAALQQYFKAMMWLQTAPFCLEKEHQLRQASFTALLLANGRSRTGKPLSDLYQSIFEPVTFLIGEPDNLSVMDLYAFLKQNNLNQPASIMQAATLARINTELLAVGKNRNRIKPKIEVSCPDKINFMPQRYLVDNEILQELVDVNENAERAYPQGLDIFAAFGVQAAQNILLQEQQEAGKWGQYLPKLNGLKAKMAGYNGWNKSVYNKWIESLVTLQQTQDNFPAFMHHAGWNKKNLNTALASWAELKHDAILYAEQPMAAECGDGGPPAPITVGYVEPNVPFWQKMVELNDLTAALLAKYHLLTEDISSKTNSLKENAVFLLSASRKELKGQKLTEQEYQAIELIGSSVEYLTLSIVEPEQGITNWEYVKGPEKSVSVVADIYTRGVPGCAKNGVLHVATGKVNDLFVVVEIEGYLYLTKGAVFSYYEFVQPPGERLTDEAWQEQLDKQKAPPIPQWMEEIMLPPKDKPVADEKIFYSSGC